VADNLTKTKHNSRWTVIGQGVGNIIAGIFGGIPGAGATMGTVTNIKAGAQTKLSGIMKGVFLLLIVISVADYVQYIPMAVLAGILITIGVGIIDYKGLRMLFKIPKQDAIVWVIVLAVTLFDNLLDAVGVGFTLSAILFIGRMTKSMTQQQATKTLDEVITEHKLPKSLADNIFVRNIDGPLFFGFADRFRDHCESLKDGMIVIFRMENAPFLDQSGIVALEMIISDWQKRGIQSYIAGANDQVIQSLEKVKIIPNLIKQEHCFDNFEDCIDAIQDKVSNLNHTSEFEKVLLEKHILKNRLKAPYIQN
jgi:SulP family sulfate permease